MSNSQPRTLCQQIYQLLDAGDIRRAGPLCEQLTGRFPGFAPGWGAFSELWQRCGGADRAADCARKACELDPGSAALRAQRARCELGRNNMLQALRFADEALGLDAPDFATLDTVGNVYSRAGEQDKALKVFEQCVEMAPEHPTALYNLATSLRFFGRIDEAESLFDRIICLSPDDHEAVHSRSVLRRQTEQHNHLEELDQRLADDPPWPAATHYWYAKGKELDDMDRHQEAFDAFSRGAALMHQNLPPVLAAEIDDIETIVAALEHGLLDRPVEGCQSEEPIFIIGLPRTGSTLIERILAGHDAIFAAGELHNFQVQARRMTGKKSLGDVYRELVNGHPEPNFSALGQAYIDSTRPRTGRTPRFVDKLPRNDRWAALIRLALPRARFILTRRDPMDSCYAMFRTLFRAGYHFTYDLETLGHYYLAHQRMISALKKTLPSDALLEMAYEDLVADPEARARELVDFCGLDWQPACLDFHRSKEAVVTASAHQVRQPVYATSVGKWRHVEQSLRPLARILGCASA